MMGFLRRLRVRKCCVMLLLVLNYYLFSISLIFYNKKVVTKFRYPLVMTYLHLAVKFLLSSAIRNIMELCKGAKQPTLGWKDYLRRIGPVGITSVLDIGLSNWSIEFITVSLYTMTKTSAIIFLFLSALILGVEKFRWLQIIVVFCVSFGLFLFTFESTQFNLSGFLLCLSASLISGVRWTLTQVICQKDELGLQNPIDFMYHIQPWMMCGLLPLAVFIEGLKFSGDDNFMDYQNTGDITYNVLILLGGALMAFGLEFGEFLLVRETSSLTMSVSAMFKECMVLLLAHWIYADQMTYLNVFGALFVIIGVVIHIYIKISKDQDNNEKNSKSRNRNEEQTTALLSSHNSDETHRETEVT